MQAGCSVTIIGIGERDSADESDGIRLLTVRGLRLAAKPVTLRRIAALAAREQADVYQCLDPWTLAVGFGLKSGRRHPRLVYDASEWFAMSFRQRSDLSRLLRSLGALMIENLERRAAAEADAVLETNLSRARRFLERGCQPALVPNYPRLSDLVAPQTQRPSHIAFTGLVSRHRGIEVVLSALAKVTKHVDGVRLRVMGDFDPRDDIEDRTKKLADDLGVAEHIDWLGWLPYPQMFGELRTSLVGIILLQPERANDYTGLPNKLFEFMGCGLAVIASDFPELAAVVRNTDCGWLVNPADPDGVAQAMLTAFQDRAATEAKGAAGRIAVLERYNWSQAEAVLLEVYKRVLG